MEKRYQVFISSTFADLEEERKEVMEAIINLNCFPAGMEMFPAADIEQFEYIKTIIDQSDYYVLVIAGRYGSVAEDGKSYTEKEYEYAKEKGIPVLVFVKKDIENILATKTDKNLELKEKLNKFREDAMTNRLAKFWDEKMELKYQVSDSLSKAFKMNPRDGWIKGDIPTNTTTLIELEKLRKEKEVLEKNIKELNIKVNEKKEKQALSQGDDLFRIEFKCAIYEDSKWDDGYVHISWNEIFIILAEIIKDASVLAIDAKGEFENSLINYVSKDCDELEISNRNFNTIKYQLEAIELLEIETSNGYEIFGLTEKGKSVFRDSMIIKR
jgi:hypothetical protein